jgi:Sec-independent protein translocase protein TatA
MGRAVGQGIREFKGSLDEPHDESGDAQARVQARNVRAASTLPEAAPYSPTTREGTTSSPPGSGATPPR